MAEDTDFLVAQDVHRFVFPDLRFGGVQQRARVEVGRLRVAREEEIEQEKTERTETEVYFSVSCRGRDAGCPTPPSQIPAGGIPAPGSSSQLALAFAIGIVFGGRKSSNR